MKRATILIMLLLLPALQAAEQSEDKIAEYFDIYVENLKAGDYAEVLNHWSLLERTLSEQLKISYEGVPVKVEVGSALLDHLEDLRAGKAELQVNEIDSNRGFARISYQINGGDSAIGVHYVNLDFSVEPEITAPLQVFAENWDHITGMYFDWIYRDASLMQERNLAVADDYVDNVARLVGLSNEKLVILSTLKARSYLCGSYGEIEQLIGEIPLGSFYQPGDAVVSRYAPDRNQIAQLLVAYANDELPPYTLPLFKYGTATFLGGHNGRSAEVALSLGRYIYANSFTKLDDLMTSAGFSTMEENPDFSYPVAALFCKFLYDKLGRKPYFELYRELSGTRTEINAITAADCRKRVANAVGSDWGTVEKEFNASVAAHCYSDIVPGAEEAGELIYQSGYSDILLSIYEDEESYHFVAKAQSADFQTAVLCGYPAETNPYQSFLFEEHFPASDYGNQHTGVIFTPNEVGCYNYYTNEITGKYIVGLTDAAALMTDKSGECRFRVLKRLLPGFTEEVKEIRSAR